MSNQPTEEKNKVNQNLKTDAANQPTKMFNQPTKIKQKQKKKTDTKQT